MPKLLVLFENAIGLSIFDCHGLNETAIQEQSVQKSIIDFSLFVQMVKLQSFLPFPSNEVAVDTLNCTTESQVSEHHRKLFGIVLESQSHRHKHQIKIGVSDPKLAGAIQSEFNTPCESGELIREILRGIRLHFLKFFNTITENDLKNAELGISHARSRAKVKFNEHGDDNMVISAISLLTSLDKNINSFSMRLREMYSLHFPELISLFDDNYLLSKAIRVIQHRSNVSKETLEEAGFESNLVDQIIQAADTSIGREIDEIDFSKVLGMADQVFNLYTYRQNLASYLYNRMHNIAPNLTSLVGESIGAQLISLSGSLSRLAKAPASTVQIMGSEKALFNALKKRKPTPKYGILFKSGQVTAAPKKEKGRVARSLSNKISIAARLDCYGDEFRSGSLGEEMKAFLDKRSEQQSKGKKQTSNYDEMLQLVQRARDRDLAQQSQITGENQQEQQVVQSSEIQETQTETPRKHKRKHRKHHETSALDGQETLVQDEQE